jgi:hypothetical protein
MKEVTGQLEENSVAIEIVDTGLDQQPEILHFIGDGAE